MISIDTGCRFEGWCGDAAVTHPVGQIEPEVQRLLDVTSGVLELAIELIGKKQRWSEVAAEMGKFVRDAGFSVVESFVGHGIGREMHEDPQVPNFVSAQLRRNGDFALEPGLVIAVEPMVNMGTKHVKEPARLLDPGHPRRAAQCPFRAHDRHHRKGPLGADRPARVRRKRPDRSVLPNGRPRVGLRAADYRPMPTPWVPASTRPTGNLSKFRARGLEPNGP